MHSLPMIRQAYSFLGSLATIASVTTLTPSFHLTRVMTTVVEKGPNIGKQSEVQSKARCLISVFCRSFSLETVSSCRDYLTIYDGSSISANSLGMCRTFFLFFYKYCLRLPNHQSNGLPRKPFLPEASVNNSKQEESF